jgi:ribosomal protein S18 acetylase RimI-like enzyme
VSDTVSARQVETLSLRAWPALRQDAYDGWLLRFGGGYTRRANSVNPLDRGRMPLVDKIAACERAFQAKGLPIVFRIPSITADTDLDAALAARGYTKSGKTSVRLADLAGFTGDLDDRVELLPHGSDDWRAALARFNRLSDAQRAGHRAITDVIEAPTMFAAARAGDVIVSVGFAVLEDRFVCLNSIATDPAQRRRGWSRATSGTLLAWARRQGATHAYLSVEKANTPAIALYNGLGFGTELYRYHYRASGV